MQGFAIGVNRFALRKFQSPSSKSAHEGGKNRLDFLKHYAFSQRECAAHKTVNFLNDLKGRAQAFAVKHVCGVDCPSFNHAPFHFVDGIDHPNNEFVANVNVSGQQPFRPADNEILGSAVEINQPFHQMLDFQPCKLDFVKFLKAGK